MLKALPILATFFFYTLPYPIALADDAPQDPRPNVVPQNTRDFVSDGSPLILEDVGLTITPLSGWEVVKNASGMTLIIQAPKGQEAKRGKWQFRRNLTVVTMHEPSPIDEIEAAKLEEQIKLAVAKGTGIPTIQVDPKHHFVDIATPSSPATTEEAAPSEPKASKNRGLVFYSYFDYQDLPMYQIHYVVSGADKRFILTYTDLAEELQKDEIYAAAWQMLQSVQVTGDAPVRYQTITIVSGILAAGLILVFALLLGRHRRATKRYRQALAAETDQTIDDFFSSEDRNEPSRQAADEDWLFSEAFDWQPQQEELELAISGSDEDRLPITSGYSYFG